MKGIWIVVGLVIVVVIGGYFLISSMSTSPLTTPSPTSSETMESQPQAMEQTIVISEQNASGESGTATLKEENGKTVVTLAITGAPQTTPQPAHIHAGSCPDVGDVTYPLTSLVDGNSVTTIDATLADLKAAAPLGINVHKSAAQASIYVSCGDVVLK